MEKVLTISIAAYNAEDDIRRCLDSFVQSSVLAELDIIVTNDGSKDKTQFIVEEYVEKYPNSIRLVNQNNGGHGSTINSGIRHAKGRYFKIVDSDDWVDKNGIEELVRFLSKTNNIDMILNPYYEVSYHDHSKKKLVNPFNERVKLNKIYGVKELNGDEILFMHSLTYRTECIKKMGPIIDERCFYVDMEYCIFPLLYVKNYVYLTFPVYNYLLGSQTQSMSNVNLIKRRDQHFKVVKQIITYFLKNQENIDLNLRKVMAKRIKYAVYQQYKIYLLMKSKQGKKEMVDFDRWLKTQNIDLYKGPEGRLMQVVKILRNTNFCFYAIVTCLL